MKRVLVIASLFVSTTALACPQLAGSYKVCKNQVGQVIAMTNLTISQDFVSGTTTYTITSTDRDSGEKDTQLYRSNGQIYISTDTDPDSGAQIKTATSAACIGDTLVASVNISVGAQTLMKATFNYSKSGTTIVNKSTLVDELGQTVTNVSICE